MGRNSILDNKIYSLIIIIINIIVIIILLLLKPWIMLDDGFSLLGEGLDRGGRGVGEGWGVKERHSAPFGMI
jgi:hypothetical protein